MKKQDGSFALNDAENADIFQPHFRKLFNRDDAPVDPIAPELVEQQQQTDETDTPPEIDEIADHIRKQINDKAPGADQVPNNALKALPDDAIDLDHQLLQRFLGRQRRLSTNGTPPF